MEEKVLMRTVILYFCMVSRKSEGMNLGKMTIVAPSTKGASTIATPPNLHVA